MPPRTATASKGDLAACLSRMDYGVAFRTALMENSSDPKVPYAGPLIDAVSLFERLAIPYALVGGVAAMYYGRARFTEDIDFVTDSPCPKSRWSKVNIRPDPHAIEIVQRATITSLAGHPIRIADPHDLIAMKLRAGSLEDDYDISEVVRGSRIDDGAVRALVSPEQFAHFQEIKTRV